MTEKAILIAEFAQSAKIEACTYFFPEIFAAEYVMKKNGLL
jgi:hypothetical protein